MLLCVQTRHKQPIAVIIDTKCYKISKYVKTKHHLKSSLIIFHTLYSPLLTQTQWELIVSHLLWSAIYMCQQPEEDEWGRESEARELPLWLNGDTERFKRLKKSPRGGKSRRTSFTKRYEWVSGVNQAVLSVDCKADTIHQLPLSPFFFTSVDFFLHS